jgi:hypothetical protein
MSLRLILKDVYIHICILEKRNRQKDVLINKTDKQHFKLISYKQKSIAY